MATAQIDVTSGRLHPLSYQRCPEAAHRAHIRRLKLLAAGRLAPIDLVSRYRSFRRAGR